MRHAREDNLAVTKSINNFSSDFHVQLVLNHFQKWEWGCKISNKAIDALSLEETYIAGHLQSAKMLVCKT